MTAVVTWDQYVDAEKVCVATLIGLDVTVTMIGATMNHPNVVEETQIQVDSRATTKKLARDKAYEARSRLLDLQPNQIGRVRLTQGPSWLPEPDGEPRYVFTATLISRAKR